MAQVDPALVEIFRRLVAGELRWPLYLHGPAGSGKTSAALALCDVIETAIHCTADGICDLEMSGDRGQAASNWAAIRDKHLAVLDEIGARSTVADLHFSLAKKFCDLREQHAQRVAVYISNVRPQAIRTLYDDRVFSRMTAGTIFHLEGRDRRCAQ